MQLEEEQGQQKVLTLKKIIITIAVVAIVASVIVTVLLFKHEKESPAADVVPVNVYQLKEVAATQTVTVAGTTKSAERAVLRFQVSGRVSSKQVRLGDKVSAGQTLIELYNPEVQPLAALASKRLQQAEVQLSQAQRDYRRLNQLYKEQAVTQNEWEQAKTAFDSAKSSVSVAQADVQRADRLAQELVLNAPFDGVVTEINVDQGETVQIGTVALQLSNPDSVELEMALSSSVVSKLAQGQEVTVVSTFAELKQPIKGVIKDISPFRERGALPQIIVSLPADQVQPGEAVKAQLQIPSAGGLNVPIKAVVMTGEDSSGVYVVDTQKSVVKLVAIRPLRIDNDSVLVDGALSYGDQLVVAGIAQLYDGARVKIRQPIGLGQSLEPQVLLDGDNDE